jgi:biotin carboxyl carrier protein
MLKVCQKTIFRSIPKRSSAKLGYAKLGSAKPILSLIRFKTNFSTIESKSKNVTKQNQPKDVQAVVTMSQQQPVSLQAPTNCKKVTVLWTGDHEDQFVEFTHLGCIVAKVGDAVKDNSCVAIVSLDTNDKLTVQMFSPVAGFVESFYLKEYDHLSRGAPIFTIVNPSKQKDVATSKEDKNTVRVPHQYCQNDFPGFKSDRQLFLGQCVKVGDQVIQGEHLFTVETWKNTSYEVQAPQSGFIASVLAEKGDRLSEGQLILTIHNIGTQKERKDPKRHRLD